MAGIRVAISSTGYWAHPTTGPLADPKARERPASLRGIVSVGSDRDGEEHFTAELCGDTADGPHELVYHGDCLLDAVVAMNEYLAHLETEGAAKSDRDEEPAWVSLAVAEESLDGVRDVIAKHHAYFGPPAPEPPKPPRPIDKLRRPLAQLRDTSQWLTTPAGTVHLASHSGRPVIYVTKAATARWVDHRTAEPLAPGEAQVYVFASPEERWQHITRRGWDRLRDDYLREELRAQYRALAHGRGSDVDFVAAYHDAEEAIRKLPCEKCGQIQWPVIDAPEAGSAEWWDDPFSYFACRACGHYLTGRPPTTVAGAAPASTRSAGPRARTRAATTTAATTASTCREGAGRSLGPLIERSEAGWPTGLGRRRTQTAARSRP